MEGHMGKKTKTKQRRLLIERVLADRREYAQFALKAYGIEQEAIAAFQVVAGLERAKECLWTESAWAMSEFLRKNVSEGDGMMMMIDADQHWWFLFEQPHSTPIGQVAAIFVLNRVDKESVIEAARMMANTIRPGGANHPSLAQLKKEIQNATPEQEQWSVAAFDQAGAVIWTMFLVKKGDEGTWTFDRNHLLPERRPGCTCEVFMEGGQPMIHAGPSCLEGVAWLITWLTTVFRMLAGEFQETPEEQEPEYITETETILVPSPRTWEPPRQEKRVHRMQVVRYDASMKKKPAHKGKRGSWLIGRERIEDESEQAIYEYEVDENAIIWVEISHKGHTRTFSAPRYKAARNTSRKFPEKRWRQPMTVATLRARRAGQKNIMEVVASKYQVQVEGE
jgi:hypothetical protein